MYICRSESSPVYLLMMMLGLVSGASIATRHKESDDRTLITLMILPSLLTTIIPATIMITTRLL